MSEKRIIKIQISHPDPKEERKAAKAFINLARALSKITGEPLEIIKLENKDKEQV